jgi:hypothetical protein
MTPSTPPVADPTERAAHLGAPAPVAHPNQKIDDESLEERRTEGMHALDNLPRKLGIEVVETRGDQFFRALPHFGFYCYLAALCFGFSRRRIPGSARAAQGRSR